MAKSMEFKALRESIQAMLEELNAPGIKETAEVINAREKMQAMAVAAEGVCIIMSVVIEDCDE